MHVLPSASAAPPTPTHTQTHTPRQLKADGCLCQEPGGGSAGAAAAEASHHLLLGLLPLLALRHQLVLGVVAKAHAHALGPQLGLQRLGNALRSGAVQGGRAVCVWGGKGRFRWGGGMGEGGGGGANWVGGWVGGYLGPPPRSRVTATLPRTHRGAPDWDSCPLRKGQFGGRRCMAGPGRLGMAAQRGALSVTWRTVWRATWRHFGFAVGGRPPTKPFSARSWRRGAAQLSSPAQHPPCGPCPGPGLLPIPSWTAAWRQCPLCASQTRRRRRGAPLLP